jgi:hypothetical protein
MPTGGFRSVEADAWRIFLQKNRGEGAPNRPILESYEWNMGFNFFRPLTPRHLRYALMIN